jgi:hypothetical protein
VALFGSLRRKPSPEPAVTPPAAPALKDVQALVTELDELLELESIHVRGRQPHLSAFQVAPVVEALADAHDPAATAALARAAGSVVGGDAPFTLALLDGLVQDGSEPAISALVGLALEGSGDVAARAARALVERAPIPAVPLTTARLTDPDPQVRGRAASVRARLGGPEAVGALAPLLTDTSPEVREQAASALAETADPRAVLPLLVAEETERRTTRAGLSSVTWTGQVSPALRAAATIVTGDGTLGWDLARQLPYAAEERLEALTEPARSAAAAQLRAATGHLAVEPLAPWTTARLEDLLTRSGVSPHLGHELRYLDGRAFVTARERCHRLALPDPQSAGDSHDTVYGEKNDWVADVTCTDGAVRLVVDAEDLRAAERQP